jgi:hypothetical protein
LPTYFIVGVNQGDQMSLRKSDPNCG